MVCGGADCPGHISLCLNINTCGLGTNNRDGRWFMRVDWKAELHSWRFEKAPIRGCECWLANQTSVRRLRFRGQTHLLLKASLFPADIINTATQHNTTSLHSLYRLSTLFLLAFIFFSCSLRVTSFPGSFLSFQFSFSHFPPSKHTPPTPHFHPLSIITQQHLQHDGSGAAKSLEW